MTIASEALGLLASHDWFVCGGGDERPPEKPSAGLLNLQDPSRPKPSAGYGRAAHGSRCSPLALPAAFLRSAARLTARFAHRSPSRRFLRSRLVSARCALPPVACLLRRASRTRLTAPFGRRSHSRCLASLDASPASPFDSTRTAPLSTHASDLPSRLPPLTLFGFGRPSRAEADRRSRAARGGRRAHATPNIQSPGGLKGRGAVAPEGSRSVGPIRANVCERGYPAERPRARRGLSRWWRFESFLRTVSLDPCFEIA
jgi:hypothetical protein